jgi:anti-sigma B factor antagonist
MPASFVSTTKDWSRMSGDRANPSPDDLPSAGQLELETSREGQWATIAVAGEVDLATVGKLEEAIAESRGEGVAAIVVDLERCSFMDSSGLALLVRAAARNGTREPAIGFAGMRGQVRRSLEISGIAAMLPVFESCADAIAALGPAAESD